MNNQGKHLRHVMLYWFKKYNSTNNITDEICIVYRSGTTTITIVHNWSHWR